MSKSRGKGEVEGGKGEKKGMIRIRSSSCGGSGGSVLEHFCLLTATV